MQRQRAAGLCTERTRQQRLTAKHKVCVETGNARQTTAEHVWRQMSELHCRLKGSYRGLTMSSTLSLLYSKTCFNKDNLINCFSKRFEYILKSNPFFIKRLVNGMLFKQNYLYSVCVGSECYTLARHANAHREP